MTETSNITAEVRAWDQVRLLPPVPGLKRQSLAATRSMLMRCEFDEGCVVPAHEHPQEQFTIVLEGRLRFTVGTSGHELELEAAAGEVVTVPPDVPHMAVALEPTISVDVFTPIRRELLPDTA